MDPQKIQRIPRQIANDKNVSLFFEQPKLNNSLPSKSDDEESGIEFPDDDKKNKRKSIDPLMNKLSKIRKTFEGNIKNSCLEETSNNEEKLTQILPIEIETNSEKEKSSKDSALSSTLNATCSTNKEINDKDQWADTFDGLDDFFDDDWSYESFKEIDLSQPKRCTIIDIVWEKMYMTLTVKDYYQGSTGVVKCHSLWRYTKVLPGEQIIIKAKKESSETKYWVIDNHNGFIVSQPNTLISGTSVVGALFCNRRSVFSEKFRGIDSLPYHNSDGSHFMLTGSLTHQMLQYVLEKNIKDIKVMYQCLENILKSRTAVEMMYDVGISMGDCKNLMKPCVPQIYNFIQRYIKGTKPEVPDKNYNGSIVEICDIEENVWIPELGLKGKIDLTVKVNDNKSNVFSKPRLVPIEIKTGRSTFSAEHRGQLLLYTMMMEHTNRQVDSGLLLYLRENIMQEIKGTCHERRDLIMLRNNTAYYTTREPTVIKSELGNESILPMELPSPISHPACAKCPYNVLCCAYLTENEKNEFNDSHVLKGMHENLLNHLSKDHIEYVLKWVSLLQLENMTENYDAISWQDVWLFKPHEREARGSCLSNLKLASVIEKNEKYLHTFNRSVIGEKSFGALDFTEKDYVIISIEDRINIASGFINKINNDNVVIIVDKNIRKIYQNEIFHIDKSESSNLLTLSLAQLGGLLDNNEICHRLRKIIIDREPASFTTALPDKIMEIGSDILNKLNRDQRSAILKVFSADNYLLIKGFPGTGKTQTLVALIQLLVKMEKSVIVTAHTNTAVDNILLKLLENNVDFIRLGSTAKMHPSIIHKSDEYLTANCDSPEMLHTIYSSKKVIGVTCYSTNHPHLSKRKFDICLVDESTQVLQPTILRPLYCASKFVLVGDPEQLPPISKNSTARKLNMNESLFARLDSKNNTMTLTMQYRMNSVIMDVANKITYNNQLKTGNEIIANAVLSVYDKTILEDREKWVKYALSLRLKNSTVMLNTSATYHLAVDPLLAQFKGSCNVWEAAITVRLLEVLEELGVKNEDIGIISPYRAQVRLLNKLLKEKVEINTVDQYQGRDKKVIIYNCSKSTPSDFKIKEYDILLDHQRLTVALTRAKQKLILIGDENTLSRYLPFEKLINALKLTNHIYNLKDGEDGFSFEDLSILLSNHLY